jgi:glycosyltransferase involved in cell wall biosynthesis
MTPIFSVVIPTYNRAHCIKNAIESVLSQGFESVEVIIVDDGSTDDTKLIVQPNLADTRVTYLEQSNKGVGSARNFGAASAVGRYLVFLDSDDQMKPEYFLSVSQQLAEFPDIVFVGVEFIVNGRFLRSDLPSQASTVTSSDGLFLAGTFIVEKHLFESVGGYDSLISYGENTELGIRLSSIVNTKVFIDVPLIRVFQNTRQRTSNSSDNLVSSISYVLEKHHDYFKRHPYNKWVYLNVLGVSLLKLNQKRQGLSVLKEAVFLHPKGIKSYLRYCLGMINFYR